jgi:hypothetical protein
MLDEIKKQIEALPEECQLIAVKEAFGGTLGVTHDLMGQKSILIADAKALCASHTALEAQVAEMKELLDVAGQFHSDNWLIFRSKNGWWLNNGIDSVVPFASPLEAFKAVKESK